MTFSKPSSNVGFTESSSSPLYAGAGSGPVLQYQTDCIGSESTFSACNSVKYSRAGSLCNHYDDVTLQCIGKCVCHMQL